MKLLATPAEESERSRKACPTGTVPGVLRKLALDAEARGWPTGCQGQCLGHLTHSASLALFTTKQAPKAGSSVRVTRMIPEDPVERDRKVEGRIQQGLHPRPPCRQRPQRATPPGIIGLDFKLVPKLQSMESSMQARSGGAHL